MVRFSFVLLIACLSSLSLTTHALSVEPTALAQLDPEKIFIDGVQYEEYQSQSIDTRIWQIDTTTRTLLIRADIDADWQEFPFPADMETVQCLEARSNDTWLVGAAYECDSLPENIRILDPATGIYTLPEVICSREVKALPGEGKWVFAWEATTDKVSLCFTETGETRTNFPDQNIWYHGGSGQVIPNNPQLSPAGQYLLLRFYTPADRPEKVSLYSYELVTGISIWLGEIELYGTYQENVTFDRWLDTTHGTVRYASSSAYLGFQIYGFDLTKTNSLHSALGGYSSVSSTMYFDEEANRYESVLSYYQTSAESGSSGNHYPCTLSTYDVNGTAKYELADHCVQLSTNYDYSPDSYTNAYRVANRYYYLAVDEDDQTVSQLRYFDLATMTVHQTYLQGEIEKIGSISPDGRYILVEFGENLEIDHLKYCCLMAKENPWMMIYDVEADQGLRGELNPKVYVTDPAAYGSSRWLDNKTILLNLALSIKHIRARKPYEDGNYDIYGVGQSGYQLIKIDANNTSTALSFPYSVLFNPYIDRLVSTDGIYVPFQRGLINQQTFIYTPIIRDDAPEYRYRVSWEAEDMIVDVLPNDYSDQPTALKKYRVKLP